MFWITVSFVLGLAIGIVIGDMLNHDSFKELFINDDNKDC